MRCARLKLWSISIPVSRVGGVSQGLFTLECEGDRLLQFLQFFCERQVAIWGHALARHRDSFGVAGDGVWWLLLMLQRARARALPWPCTCVREIS